MREKDFIELIDLKAEYKEYLRFRSGKSKKYRSFAEWDAHIKSLLVAIELPTDMYNLKRYCMNMVRSEADISQIIWGYLGLAFPIILLFSTESEKIGWKGIASMIILMLVVYCVTNIVKNYSKEKYFYEDILSIINTLETNVDQ